MTFDLPRFLKVNSLFNIIARVNLNDDLLPTLSESLIENTYSTSENQLERMYILISSVRKILRYFLTGLVAFDLPRFLKVNSLFKIIATVTLNDDLLPTLSESLIEKPYMTSDAFFTYFFL